MVDVVGANREGGRFRDQIADPGQERFVSLGVMGLAAAGAGLGSPTRAL